MKSNSGEIMNKFLNAALVLGTVASMTGCAISPPYVTYSDPRIEVIRPAPYYVRPAPYYAPGPYYRPYRDRGHRRWD